MAFVVGESTNVVRRLLVGSFICVTVITVSLELNGTWWNNNDFAKHASDDNHRAPRVLYVIQSRRRTTGSKDPSREPF